MAKEDTIASQRITKKLHELMLKEKKFHKNLGIKMTQKKSNNACKK